MTTTAGTTRISAAAWRMLALGVLAQAAGTLVVSTPAYLIPLLHLEEGIPLPQVGLLVAAPTVGLVLTLVAWGALADRVGERWVIAGGLGLAAVFTAIAAAAGGLVPVGVLLLLAGGATGSCKRGERPGRRGLVPEAAPRAGDGDPADVAAARRRGRRAGRAAARGGGRHRAAPGRRRGRHRRARTRLRRRHHRPAPAAAERARGGGQPLSTRPVPPPGPRRVGTARRAPVHALHVRAALADRRPALVGDGRRRRRGGRAVRRCRRPHRGRVAERPVRAHATPPPRRRRRGRRAAAAPPSQAGWAGRCRRRSC